jgi:hypothetical protein
MVEAIQFAQNVYNATAWNIVPHAVVTDTVPNTFTRSPGSTQVKQSKTLKRETF